MRRIRKVWLMHVSKCYTMEKYVAGIVCISERKLAINDHCPFLVNSHCGITQSSRCPARHVLCAPPYHAKASFVIPFLPLVDKGHIFPEVSPQWRHNDRDGVLNHQPQDCLLNRLFRRRSKKTPKLRVTGLCEGNSPVTGEFPAERPVTRKMSPFDDVIMCYIKRLPRDPWRAWRWDITRI